MTVVPTPTPTPTPTITVVPGTGSKLSAIWANEGGDKVTRDDLRASKGSVINSVWNGSKISVSAAKNEVVNFNLVLEAASTSASAVSVKLASLVGPGGTIISSTPVTGLGIYDFTQRNIELFYVRYLQIKGLSQLAYANYYDERHVPIRLRRPWTGAGVATGTWASRPDHDKFYPDIAQPLEIKPLFDIAKANSQSIWVDIYVPKTAVAGVYTGTVVITESGVATRTLPVELTVRNFALPDVPSAKTMLATGKGDLNQRYTGVQWPNPGSPEDLVINRVIDKQFQVAHRHKISLIDSSDETANKPAPEWTSRLNGSLFTAAKGYDGPGVGIGNNIYTIGLYGSWNPGTPTQAWMKTFSDAWETTFQTSFPGVDHFVYLIDESDNAPQIQQWASWIKAGSGVGAKLPTMATIDLKTASASTPALTYPTTAGGLSITASMDAALAKLRTDPAKKFFEYNGSRPAGGTFVTDDDGVALRVSSWAQFKKGIDRWFYWQSTYYNDYQGGRGQTNVFQNAQTFGGPSTIDPIEGEKGWNHTNGDGVLFYPGIDKVFPAESLGIEGPIASLRLKYWRRGVQDVDYLTLAKAKDPVATQAIVNRMIPKVLWELGVDNPADPTYLHSDISWSVNPDDWEKARADLAAIILK